MHWNIERFWSIFSSCIVTGRRTIYPGIPAPFLSSHAKRIQYLTFIFAPQCPVGAGFSRLHGYNSIDSLVFEAIEALDDEFAINKSRRYVASSSGGGFGSWNFICSRPDLFAAAIPICGQGNPALAPKAAEVPVWAFHGAKDRQVPQTGSREMIEAIRNAGGEPKYTEFPNAKHYIFEEVKSTPGVFDCLFEQQKD